MSPGHRPHLLACLCLCALPAVPGCSDDETATPRPCAELAAAVLMATDEACLEWPDCPLCEVTAGEAVEGLTEEECEELVGTWDHDVMVEAYDALCELMASSDTDVDSDSDTDSDTDTDTDADTDTDTETDTEICDGYTGDDPCCTNDNPCDWELNDICDCDSTCAWDAVDCEW
jgi:hypothetical protein